jgi:hypothetical protein
VSSSVSTSVEAGITETYIDRVRHIDVSLGSVDDEYRYVQSLEENVERIEVVYDPERSATTLIVTGEQAVYTFHSFRSDYVGHASRRLLAALEHLGLLLDANFLSHHPTFTAYMPDEEGAQLICGSDEYTLAPRGNVYEIVFYVDLSLSARCLDYLADLRRLYPDLSEAVLVEQAVEYAHSQLVLYAPESPDEDGPDDEPSDVLNRSQ